ncbi:MAG TPA: hypothetical protein VI653_09055 [Steroidobacteraceae bacterium]
MSLQDPTTVQGAIEECLDEINDFVATLDRYPPTAVAVAMSVHLQTMLSALVECDLCTPQQVKDFVRELERDVSEEIKHCYPGRFFGNHPRPKPLA